MGKVKGRLLEAPSKEQRQADRQKLGSLKSLTVSSKTRVRYERAREKFYGFLHENELQLPRKREQLDGLLSEYIEHLWSSGEGRALAADTIAGLQDMDPKVKGHLPASWRLLKTWGINEIPNRAPPLPEHAVLAMAGWAFFHQHFAFGISLLVAFYGMLRTGEVLNLTNADMFMTSIRSPAVLSLGMTKGGKRQGVAESCTLTPQVVLQWVWHWKKCNTPHAKLCQSSSSWRAMFSKCLTALNLDSFQFRPYSLRRGGATWWFSRHGSLDKLMVAGRWQAVKTARLYINEGLAVVADLKLPQKDIVPFSKVFHSLKPEINLSSRNRK